MYRFHKIRLSSLYYSIVEYFLIKLGLVELLSEYSCNKTLKYCPCPQLQIELTRCILIAINDIGEHDFRLQNTH